MKLFLPLSVLVLGLFATNAHADPVLTINAAAGLGTLTETIVGGVDTFSFVDDSTVVGVGPLHLGTQTDNDALTAVFSDVGGIAILNVTDVCANAALLAPVNPCAGFAFSDTALGIPEILSATGNLAAAADVNVGLLGIDLAGVSLGNGTEEIGFNNPPPSSITPEPSALTLFGTGLLGLAGVMKKKFCA
jgi:ethanolamine ammonia-lyase large subunit